MALLFLHVLTMIGLTIASPVADRSDQGQDDPSPRLWDQPFVDGDMIPENPNDTCIEPKKNDLPRWMMGIALFNALWRESDKWPKGVIPYVIQKGHFDTDQHDKILKGIAHIENRTCVKFVPRQEEEQYLLVSTGEGCSSGVGRYNDHTTMTLSVGCFDYHGATVIHELLHAVGLTHEHNRYDRDQYVIIHDGNITMGDQSYDSAFGKACPPKWNTYNLSYDYTSIMHYGKDYFGNPDGAITVETKDSKYQDVIGHAKGMSKIDATKVNRMYGCEDPKWEDANDIGN